MVAGSIRVLRYKPRLVVRFQHQLHGLAAAADGSFSEAQRAALDRIAKEVARTASDVLDPKAHAAAEVHEARDRRAQKKKTAQAPPTAKRKSATPAKDRGDSAANKRSRRL